MESAITANSLAEVDQLTPNVTRPNSPSQTLPNQPDEAESSKTAAEAQPKPALVKEQSLDNEISAVLGNLTSFWGVFKRESEATIASVTREISELQKTDFETVRARSKSLLDQGEILLSRGESFLQKQESKILARGESLLHQVESTFKNAIEVVAPPEDSTSKETRTSIDATTPAISRVDQLISRLRSDAKILRVDPQAEPAWELYLKKVASSESSWQNVRDKELGLDANDVLLAQVSSLVPETLTEEQFWTRYGYRLDQIMTQEESRQSLLAAAQKKDQEPDNFSWDDEGVTPATASLPNDQTTLNKDFSDQSTSTAISPRASEDSYDIVSRTGSEKMIKGSTTAGTMTPASTIDEEAPESEKTGVKKDADSEDSDWE